LVYSPYIIGKRRYTYIEDAPNVLTFYFSSKLYKKHCDYWSGHFLFLKKMANFFISDVRNRPVANNRQCNELLLTTDDNVPYITGKKKVVISLNEIWDNMNELKKQYILDVYDISCADIQSFETKSHIVLTQQFSSAGLISEKDQIEIYAKIIRNYDPFSLVIKPHPRDHVNYNKYFPDIFVFDKPVPMQLLSIMGVRFKKAITLFSSSINSFSYEIEKEWLGSSVHPVLFERYPNLGCNIHMH
jgi:hypothetical protein